MIVLECLTVLQQYYKVGYGHAVNYEISCPLLADMFRHMDDTVSGYRYVGRVTKVLFFMAGYY